MKINVFHCYKLQFIVIFEISFFIINVRPKLNYQEYVRHDSHASVCYLFIHFYFFSWALALTDSSLQWDKFNHNNVTLVDQREHTSWFYRNFPGFGDFVPSSQKCLSGQMHVPVLPCFSAKIHLQIRSRQCLMWSLILTCHTSSFSTF